MTVREHLGAVYNIAANEQFLFTGGAEGVLRRWKMKDLLQGLSSDWEGDCHEEPIWSLAMHHKRNLILTSSADSSLKLLKNCSDNIIDQEIQWS